MLQKATSWSAPEAALITGELRCTEAGLYMAGMDELFAKFDLLIEVTKLFALLMQGRLREVPNFDGK